MFLKDGKKKKTWQIMFFMKWFNMTMKILPRFPPKINSKIVIGIWHFGPEEIWENNKQD